MQRECCRRFASDQFRRVVPIAIDHHRHSTNAGQYEIGRVVNLELAGTRVACVETEVAARAASLGLWRDGSPVAPWEWRHWT